MVLTKSQIENLSREGLIEELLQLSDVSIQLKALINDAFALKYEELKSYLLVTKNCSTLLNKHIIQLEQNGVNNAQYHQS